jgi:diguanylate cyclase (GGDEF)-like protein/PAS domain S-box-containing protein
MTVPVRALLVDDSASNTGLLFEELRRGGFDPYLERVTSRDALEAALAASSWDVVLSDTAVETLGVFDALAILKERDLDVPFLIVSENLGEETAIRAMRAGAQNCIPRESLARLCPILEREMREAQSRRERRAAQRALTEIEEALRLSEERFRALFERNLAGVYRSTLEGRILDCNESFARIFGYASREEVLQQAAWDFYVKPEDRQAALGKLLERHSLTNYELCLKRKDGSLVWVLESEDLIEGPDGRMSVIEGTTIDITERKRAEEQVKHLAFHDPLTNLPNRLLFSDRLTLAVAQAHRHNQRLAVLFLDLDRFKVINDSLGHSVGDELLRQVAERIQEYVREGDTVARLGGDEFTLLVPGITAEEDAAKIAKKICDAIHDPFWIDGRELFVTTSMGVAVYPSDGHDAETLVRNADSAMYRAKEQGRDNYQLYTPAMNAKAVERLSLESRLRQAVANDELELHFQPFFDLKTAEVLGAEALLRWRHPELGLIPPGEFIPIAELSGLIVPIGEWVLRTACAAARKWHAQGFPSLTVSVNLSSRQFQQSDLVSQVTSALTETGLEPDKLDLEITESNAMQNAEHSINTLWGLKKQGVRISMDDFGTGYSSLNYLKRFPIDRIKLDQSFVRDLPGDKDDAAIAMAVIAMGRSLELVVIAEGVETEEQLAFLKDRNCDQLQGFLFSRPLPPEAFASFLEEGRIAADPGRSWAVREH